jgi:N-acetylneuraminate synthase
MFGPDVVASVTADELRQMVQGIRFIERMKSHPINRFGRPEVAGLRETFGKSIVARTDLPAGTVLPRSISR